MMHTTEKQHHVHRATELYRDLLPAKYVTPEKMARFRRWLKAQNIHKLRKTVQILDDGNDAR